LLSYEDWGESYFTPEELADPQVSLETCDPDSDRLENLMEYALGLDPTLADVAGRPQGRMEDGKFVVRYTKRMGLVGVSLSVEAATAAQGPWSGDGWIEHLRGSEGGVEMFDVIRPIQAADTALFIRLKVEK